MVVIPPAKGKTRISMAVALLLLRKFKKASKVVVAFPNKLLKDQDGEAWQKVETLFGDLGASLKLVVGIEEMDQEADRDTLLLIDEADKMLIDDMNGLPRNYKACTGFTATIASNEESNIVKKRLEKTLNFGI